MFSALASFVPLVVVFVVVGVALWAAHWLLLGQNPDIGNERKFPRHLAMLGLTLFGLVACVLVLPVSEASRNQLIGLVGIVLSGVIAFSSTTIIANLMAGLLLRITKPFSVGDFIRVGDYFGRVSERGLFDTEIQTETRELISLPNSYCINHPVATILGSGTIISATLSLGYDVDHKRIEALLVEAGLSCGLQEPFVHILELGNFSVTYRVSGLLEEAKRLITAQSSLYGCVLDTLHSQGIEIMSPAFMNQRRLEEGARILPPHSVVDIPPSVSTTAEDIAFDKAEKAERKEQEKQQLIDEIALLEHAIRESTDDEQKKINQATLDVKQGELKALEAMNDQEELSKKGSTSQKIGISRNDQD